MTNSIKRPVMKENASIMQRIIQERKTCKVFADPEHRHVYESAWTELHSATLCSMVESAGWAPFHRRAHEKTHRSGHLNSPMPWRFYVLEGKALSRLLIFFEQKTTSSTDSKWNKAWDSKVKNMLSACGAMIQVTWLPEPHEGSSVPAMSMNNIEHIAAAGAAVQNLLLSAEAADWQSYWSSGGILRDPELFLKLGIDQNQLPLGSIFLTPPGMPQSRNVAGALRGERGTVSEWVQWVELG